MCIRDSSGDIAKWWKNAICRNVEESFEKFLDLDPEADDFQINQFFLVHRYTCGKIFAKTIQ